MKRKVIALTFLIEYNEESDDFLSRIVSEQRRWVSHETPESRQQLHNDNEIKQAGNMWFAKQAVSFYDEGIQLLVIGYDNNGGNYVDKKWIICVSLLQSL